MTTHWYDIIGYFAAICIAVYMMPQLIKTIKTKDTSGVSIIMFIIALFGDLFFVIDGIGMLADNNPSGLPILLANLAALIISGIIAFYKFRNMHMSRKLNMTEKDFCLGYKANRDLYKQKFGKKNLVDTPIDTPTAPVNL